MLTYCSVPHARNYAGVARISVRIIFAVDREVLFEQIRGTLSASPRPLSARELGPIVEADQYALRSALNHMRRLGELTAAMGDVGDTLVYRMRADGEPLQPMEGLTTRRKNGTGVNGHHKANGHTGSIAKKELLEIIEVMAENPILVRLVRLYGSL
jgi:hypothetical protein